jgi:hypothetical protein
MYYRSPFLCHTTGKTAFCIGSKPSFVLDIEPVQIIRYKCRRAFVPGEIPGTNATHLYRAEVPPGTNDFFCSLFFFSLTYLLKVLILIVIRCGI